MNYEPSPGIGRPALMMHGLAVVILLLMWIWGAVLYPSLPQLVPTHWDMSGEADAFSQRSLASVFGPLLVASVLLVSVLLVNLGLSRARYLVSAERRAYGISFSYVNLSLALIFAWVSLAGWYGFSLGPLFVAFALLAGMPVLVIVGLHLPEIMRQRKAEMDPADPSQNPKHWVLGGIFYSNPNDPRAFVPRAPHTGTGTTMNLATPLGRLALIGLLVVIFGTLALTILL